jgi:hypothetical protein
MSHGLNGFSGFQSVKSVQSVAYFVFPFFACVVLRAVLI